MADQVFMCYAREDEDFVLKLAGALKAQGVPVWLDQWELPGGVDWALEVEEALYRSSHLVVVISPASRASEEVRGEWRGALDEGIPVIPVLFEECRIPLRLRLLQHIDFTSRPPTDATAVGEIVSALAMERRAAEKEERPPDLSAEPSAGSSSGVDLPVGEPSGNICHACGSAYEAGAVFCDYCGSPLRAAPQDPVPSGNICLACGAENLPDEVFCENCGAALTPASPVPEPSGNICPACGAAYEPGEAFCAMCGASLPSAPSA